MDAALWNVDGCDGMDFPGWGGVQSTVVIDTGEFILHMMSHIFLENKRVQTEV